MPQCCPNCHTTGPSGVRASFTLIELLVVVAIIGILASMLLPVLSKARNNVKTTSCSNQMRNLGMMTELYIEDSGNYLPRGYNDSTNWSWLIQRLVAKYPQLQNIAAPRDMGFETWFLAYNYITLGEIERANPLKCPADPREDWTPAHAFPTAAQVINTTRTQVVT